MRLFVPPFVGAKPAGPPVKAASMSFGLAHLGRRPVPFAASPQFRRVQHLCKVRAQNDGQSGPEKSPGQQQQVEQQQGRRRKPNQNEGFSLEDLNPISMGRRSREVFDDVWLQLQRIGSPSRSLLYDEEDYR